MKMIIKNPGEKHLIKEMDDNLKLLQDMLGGYIEYPYIEPLHKQNIAMIVNEEGKLFNLPPSILLIHDGEVCDMIAGSAIFVGLKYTEEGIENTDLTNEQIEFINKLINYNSFGMTKEGQVIPTMQI